MDYAQITDALLQIIATCGEDAASDENVTGYGCYLVLGPRIDLPLAAYLVRRNTVGSWSNAYVETFDTAQAGWDRFNALCAAD